MEPVTPNLPALSAEEVRLWMDALSRVAGIAIPEASRPEVEAQLALNHRLVAPLLAFEIPEGVAPAPRFQP